MHAARECEMLSACFRNYEFLSSYLMEHHSRIAVIGAGTRGSSVKKTDVLFLDRRAPDESGI